MRRSLTFAICLALLGGVPASAEDTPPPHPVHVLDALWPGAGTGPQRLEKRVSPAQYKVCLDAMEAAYGAATNGRGETLVWSIPLSAPVYEQADEVTVMLDPSKGKYVVSLDDRAPQQSRAVRQDRQRKPKTKKKPKPKPKPKTSKTVE